MTRPVVGLTAYREQARWRVWDTSADLLPTVYARSLEEAGAVPVLLPPVRPSGRTAELVVSRLDGLVFTGGPDVDPRRYAAEPHAATDPAQEGRDGWELALLDAATGVDLPILGICRGMQRMAVHAGGVLEQHLPEVTGDHRHSPAPSGAFALSGALGTTVLHRIARPREPGGTARPAVQALDCAAGVGRTDARHRTRHRTETEGPP